MEKKYYSSGRWANRVNERKMPGGAEEQEDGEDSKKEKKVEQPAA